MKVLVTLKEGLIQVKECAEFVIDLIGIIYLLKILIIPAH